MGTKRDIGTLLQNRIAVIDGAMGTMIQRRRPDEATYRGSLLADHDRELAGANDVLALTQPQLIREIHEEFLAAGADIIESNTFSAQAISLADYGLEERVREVNLAAVRVAREAADAFSARTPDQPRFVAGSIGPTTVTASLSPDVNDPGFRAVTFDRLVEVFTEQVEALLEGGVDLLLPETTIDTLNLKAALFAIEEVFERLGRRVPVIASLTITDASGRVLSGQTLEAAWISIAHARPLAPNAGLPNEFGGYDETPEQMAAVLREFAERDGSTSSAAAAARRQSTSPPSPRLCGCPPRPARGRWLDTAQRVSSRW
jgi:5-methyltetrahydrofolate--homocysteine methyltransferase